jgi:4-hydroxy-3-methylbut-2-enyl diphosphate reductase IspH
LAHQQALQHLQQHCMSVLVVVPTLHSSSAVRQMQVAVAELSAGAAVQAQQHLGLPLVGLQRRQAVVMRRHAFTFSE